MAPTDARGSVLEVAARSARVACPPARTANVVDVANVFLRVLQDTSARGYYIVGNGLNPTGAELAVIAILAGRRVGRPASCAALAQPSLLAHDFHHGNQVPLTAATSDSFDKMIMSHASQRRGSARLVS